MVSKVIDATEMRVNTFVMIDGVAHQVKKFDISKTGKHGHAKVRFEAINAFTGKKKVQVIPGHDKFEVPMIEKRRGQILSIANNQASIMDTESFENLDLAISEDLEGNLRDGAEVEYWDIEGQKILKKVM